MASLDVLRIGHAHLLSVSGSVGPFSSAARIEAACRPPPAGAVPAPGVTAGPVARPVDLTASSDRQSRCAALRLGMGTAQRRLRSPDTVIPRPPSCRSPGATRGQEQLEHVVDRDDAEHRAGAPRRARGRRSGCSPTSSAPWRRRPSRHGRGPRSGRPTSRAGRRARPWTSVRPGRSPRRRPSRPVANTTPRASGGRSSLRIASRASATAVRSGGHRKSGLIRPPAVSGW